MIKERKIAFDNISSTLAITRYDIEQHQLINDQSLNIHGENWFRDIFNYVYSLDLVNANFGTSNSPAIDLVDVNMKTAYQITSSRSKEKVEKTLIKIKKTKYRTFNLKIFFITQKSMFNQATIDYFKNTYKINIQHYLFDYTDLIKSIDSLDSEKIIALNDKYFISKKGKYTNEMVLNLVIKHLLSKNKDIKKDYDDDFGNIDTNTKIKLNNLNERIASAIKAGLDYRVIIDDYINDGRLITSLENFIIKNLYKNILVSELNGKIALQQLLDKSIFELQNIAKQNNISFSKLIKKLHQEIENKIEIKDFNTQNIAWIIIAYFFEICDIGVKT